MTCVLGNGITLCPSAPQVLELIVSFGVEMKQFLLLGVKAIAAFEWNCIIEYGIITPSFP